MIRVDVSGLSEAEKAIRTFAAGVSDLRPFWRELGESPGRRRPSALAATPTYRHAPNVFDVAPAHARPGRCVRVLTQSAHIRDERVLFEICANRHQATAGYTPDPHRRSAAQRAVDDLAPGPGGVGGFGGRMTPYQEAVQETPTTPGGRGRPRRRSRAGLVPGGGYLWRDGLALVGRRRSGASSVDTNQRRRRSVRCAEEQL